MVWGQRRKRANVRRAKVWYAAVCDVGRFRWVEAESVGPEYRRMRVRVWVQHRFVLGEGIRQKFRIRPDNGGSRAARCARMTKHPPSWARFRARTDLLVPQGIEPHPGPSAPPPAVRFQFPALQPKGPGPVVRQRPLPCFRAPGKKAVECVGDIMMGFHNIRGLRGQGKKGDHYKMIQYIENLMRRYGIAGICETNEDAAMGKVWESDEGFKARYAVVSAPPPPEVDNGSGVALVMRRGVADLASIDVVYRDPKGKALAVNMRLGELEACVVVAHLEHKPEKKVEQLRTLRQAVHVSRGRQVIWMADFNFVEAPALDKFYVREDKENGTFREGGTHKDQPSSELAEEFIKVCEAWGGLMDVYRAMHGEKREEVTRFHHKDGNEEGPIVSGSRIDRIYVSPGLLTSARPGIFSMGHVTPSTFTVVARRAGEKRKVSDHYAVEIGLRFTGNEKPAPKWRFSPKMVKTEEGRKAVKEATEEAVRGGGDVYERHARIGGMVADACKARAKAERQARFGKEKRLRSREARFLKEVIAHRDDATVARAFERQAARAGRQLQTLLAARRIEDLSSRKRVEFSDEDRGGRAHFEPLRKPRDQVPIMHLRAAAQGPCRPDEVVSADLKGHEEMAEYLRERWSSLFNLGIDLRGARVRAKTAKALASIRRDEAHRVTEAAAATLSIESIFSLENIRAAVRSVKKGTVPGEDGLSIEFYLAQEEVMVPHLREFFLAMNSKGEMTPAMREAVITLLHKKGDRAEWRNYRPVSVTAIEYRILGRAIHLKMRPVMSTILGEQQVGFQRWRRIEDNILCVAELARFCQLKERGAVFVMLDNEKAYDRVQWGFMQDVLEAFGFPDDFRRLIRIMYTNISSAIKLNGMKGEAFEVSNGVRQGCVCSTSLYNLCHEVFLRMIREDKKLKGVRIPGSKGEWGEGEGSTLRERSFADDTGVALPSFDQLPHLMKIITEYGEISGAKVNEGKTVGLVMGTLRDEAPPPSREWKGKWVMYAEEAMETKYLGIKFGSSAQVATQWEAMIDKITAEVKSAMARHTPRSVYGRALWVKASLASKAWFTFKAQSPSERERERLLTRFQQEVVNRGYFGDSSFVKHDLAMQGYENGGMRMLDVRAHLAGEGVSLVKRLVREESEGEPASPWKNFWLHSLGEVYGSLGQGARLVTSTCGFERLRTAPEDAVSHVQRAAFAAWGRLRVEPMERLQPAEAEAETSGEGERRRKKKGVKPRPWTYDRAVKSPIFFDLWEEGRYVGVRRGRESEERWRQRVEGEREEVALEWAEAGLVRMEHLLAPDGKELMSDGEFRRRYPDLNREVYARVRRGRRGGWEEAVRNGGRRWAEGAWVKVAGDEGVWRVETKRGFDRESDCIMGTVMEWGGKKEGETLVEGRRRLRVYGHELSAVEVRTRGGEGDAPEVHRLVSRDLEDVPAEPAEMGVAGGKELVKREAVSIEKITVEGVKAVRAARVFEMPRAFAEGGCHWRMAQRVPGGAAFCIERTRNTALPRYLRETVYRVAIDGYPIGRRMTAGGKKPEEGRCAVTGKEETVAHVFAGSPAARALWRRVVKGWRGAVGEDLRQCWKTAALVGHRETGDRAELEEPFAILRAIVLRILWKERCAVRNGAAARTTQALHDEVKRGLLEAADGRRAQVRRLTEEDDPAARKGEKHSMEQFAKAWVHSGLVKTLEGTRTLNVVLRYQ